MDWLELFCSVDRAGRKKEFHSQLSQHGKTKKSTNKSNLNNNEISLKRASLEQLEHTLRLACAYEWWICM